MYGGSEVTEADPECVLEWSVDGRQTRSGDNQRSNVSRRLRVSWSSDSTVSGHPREQEFYLLFVPPRKSTRANSDINSLWETGTQFFGRDYSGRGNQALMRSWINICETQHKDACAPIEGRSAFLDLIRQTSFGVIDVADLQLTQLPIVDGKPARYAALSYVWGPERTEDHRTLRSNVFERIKHGGLEQLVSESLPSTIKHAIQLVRDLGERYLWVDSLCIVQDSVSSWRLNAQSMDLIYGNAYFTICAADGDNSDAGLVATGFGPESPERPLKAEILPGLELLVSRPLEEIIQASVWNRRAWTFQERILSRRCLVFVGKRVYFQCRGTNMSQDVYPDPSGKGWSLDWRDSPLRTLRDAVERPIWFYMTCVSLYTGRGLTKRTDILPAFEGVSQLMARYMEAPFFYCLPASHFDFALLWQPTAAQKRRLPHQGSHHDWNENAEFPSWSWAGWEDDKDPHHGAHVSYDHKFLEGCLIDMHDWLIHRTWIDWNIRDADGNLKNLWNNFSEALRGRQMSERQKYRYERQMGDRARESAPERWSGYRKMPPQREVVDGYHSDSPDLEGSDYERRRYTADPENNDRIATEVEALSSYVVRRRSPTPREPLFDRYGRQNRYSNMDKKLRTVLPDNPFGVRPSQRGRDDPAFTQPILQFRTWMSSFYILRDAEGKSPGEGLARCHVADRAQDWCGTVVVNEEWAQGRQGRLCSFIALSEAKSFTDEECVHWAHYIAKDRDEIEWDLFYVLLIEYNSKRLLWERVGLGKIFQQAFDWDQESWTELTLG
ncbi:HET-domain-containing protein [Pleurostoma richardsiae]|uniref:HET-domain-containing protein n=1 Tax=Pleurostoma richardsiae TaxID=41990 RepID=A0AA38RLI3_9PEZI|nr:HET-domain-containing protein [Pleurostoma richardsiae]